MSNGVKEFMSKGSGSSSFGRSGRSGRSGFLPGDQYRFPLSLKLFFLYSVRWTCPSAGVGDL